MHFSNSLISTPSHDSPSSPCVEGNHYPGFNHCKLFLSVLKYHLIGIIIFISLCLASFDPFYVCKILLCLHIAVICIPLLKHSIPVYEYTIFYLFILLFGLFPVWGYYRMCCYEYFFISFGVCMYPFLLVICIRVKLLVYRVCVCSTLVGATIYG